MAEMTLTDEQRNDIAEQLNGMRTYERKLSLALGKCGTSLFLKDQHGFESGLRDAKIFAEAMLEGITAIMETH